MVRLLMEFCSIQAENPPGSFLRQSQTWIESTLSRYGIRRTILKPL